MDPDAPLEWWTTVVLKVVFKVVLKVDVQGDLMKLKTIAKWGIHVLVGCLAAACGPERELGPEATGPVQESLTDDFGGSGPLLNYRTNNATALPEVTRSDGRYRAVLTNNSANKTLHFHKDQGRLDAKLVSFPFEVIARNIGIGTLENSQVAPSPEGEPFVFAGLQVHVTNLASINSSHVVVGHRGGSPFTVEAKNTVDGRSTVNDAGANIVPDGRADLRVVGGSDRKLTLYWQRPNLALEKQSDNWMAYNGTGEFPGRTPQYGDRVYVGLITYAFGNKAIPFVGTCDALEGASMK